MAACSEYVAIVQRFVETRSAFEAGAVAHALCAAMRDLLTDWQLMVTQLEHQLLIGSLTLQVRTQGEPCILERDYTYFHAQMTMPNR